jgi:carbamate kinase
MIGYLLEQELGNLLPIEVPFASLLTMIEVDAHDPAFENPTTFGTPNARKLGRTTPAKLANHELPAGSMGAKVEAGCEFATSSNRQAAIGALADIERIVAGEAGTLIEVA